MPFAEQWEMFLHGVENTIRDKEEHRDLDHEEYSHLDQEEVRSLVSDVIETLRSDEAMIEVGRAARHLDGETREFLRREIELWNESADTDPRDEDSEPSRFSGNQSSELAEDTADTKLQEAQTVKDSVEQLLGLPSWLRNPLQILNQVLSLVTGG